MTTLTEALTAKPHLLAVESFDGKEFIVKAISALSGGGSGMGLEITEAQLYAWAVDGVVAQKAFPQLSRDEREFLQTGIRSNEWDTLTPQDEDR